MSPVHGSDIAHAIFLRIGILVLIVVASGCGRSRSKSESVQATQAEATTSSIAPEPTEDLPDHATAVIMEESDDVLSPGELMHDAEIQEEFESEALAMAAEPAAVNDPANAFAPLAPTSADAVANAPTARRPAPTATPTLQGTQAARIAGMQNARAKAKRATSARLQSKSATALQERSAATAADRFDANRAGTASAGSAAFNSISVEASISGAAPEISEPEPTADRARLQDETATSPTPTNLPAGSTLNERDGYTTVPVYYATDRSKNHLPLSAYEVTGDKQLLTTLGIGCLLSIAISAVCGLRGRTWLAATSSAVACLTGALAIVCVSAGGATIEKHGVTYTGDRGTLTRGICEVTVPKLHRSGIVERPSMLRLEFREDQQKHIVLTSAMELSEDEFHARLAESITDSPEQDLLVFIHGYNVNFPSAVRRTAQIAVDLPFEGVPVCYTWPSQGALLGYSVDETNAEWTTTHLKQFLLELVEETGAKSINVIAHSMGNRPMTAAMEQISWQMDSDARAPFDRIVLAAPDVDADRFRRDLGPSLSRVANHVTLYASSDDQALIASKQVHGYPRAGESGDHVVVVPGVETIDVSGIDLSLLGHSYYGDSESMLRDLYEVVRSRLSAPQRPSLITRQQGELVYWQLALQNSESTTR